MPARVRDALLGQANDLRAILDAVLAYEDGRWDEATARAHALGANPDLLSEAYADALLWTRELATAA